MKAKRITQAEIATLKREVRAYIRRARVQCFSHWPWTETQRAELWRLFMIVDRTVAKEHRR